jgi:hypothetical protein
MAEDISFFLLVLDIKPGIAPVRQSDLALSFKVL